MLALQTAPLDTATVAADTVATAVAEPTSHHNNAIPIYCLSYPPAE